ncbi:Arc family DNA-binding protein [Altericroceibacterium xinjiangense]|uniref:Arc family DNA-binding protein n=1 Tax=Altericroceibacterium xinjiangense TaxID=762261 RepID=UPI000F7D67CB|nr:Arc family DNA-binding protein [Altericroceibacterium xinjiangense]
MPRKTDKSRDPQQIVGIQLRFREALRSQLGDAASASGNSMNSEIVERLNSSLAEDRLFGRGLNRRLLIEIANQIARAEAITGKTWHDDASTYWVVRRLVDDVWQRHRPVPANFEAIREQESYLHQLRERRDALVTFLKGCDAVDPANALTLAFGPAAGDKFHTPAQSERWRNPKAPGQPVSDEDQAFIEERVAELETVEDEIEALNRVIHELLTPWRVAKTDGNALYERLTTSEAVDEDQG